VVTCPVCSAVLSSTSADKCLIGLNEAECRAYAEENEVLFMVQTDAVEESYPRGCSYAELSKVRNIIWNDDVADHDHPQALRICLLQDEAAGGATTDKTAFVCDVWPGLRECGGSKWAQGGGSSHVIEVEGWAKGSSYSYFAIFGQRSCNGYGLPSSSDLAGGKDGGVNCQGDCTTGAGYCYSTNDGLLCANCKLWGADPAKGEVLCTEVGLPQSGILPGSADWTNIEKGCAQEAWSQAQQDATDFALIDAGGRLLRSMPTVRLIVDGVVAHSLQLPSYGALASSDASWLFCITISENGPLLQLGTQTAVDGTMLYSEVEDPIKTCAARVVEHPTWACSSQDTSLGDEEAGRRVFGCHGDPHWPAAEPTEVPAADS